MAGRVVLFGGRIVALVVLALATGWSLAPVQRSIATLDIDGLVRGSIAMSLVALAFVVVMLVGRRSWHPWALLGIEAAVAAALAFVPAVLWMVWFEPSSLTMALSRGWVQPLAAAWLGVVVLRGLHQWREPRPRPPEETEPGAPAPRKRRSAASAPTSAEPVPRRRRAG